MPRSRVCPSCGIDTSGSPPLLDHELGLMIARCGRCSQAMVIRRHAGLVEWARLMRRWLHAVAWAVVQGGLAAATLVLVPLACMGLQHSMAVHGCDPWSILTSGQDPAAAPLAARLSEWYHSGQSVLYVAWILSSAGAGLWIGAMLGHAEHLRSLATVVAMAAIVAVYFTWIRSSLITRSSPIPVWNSLVGSAIFAVLTAPVMALAIPIGAAASKVGSECRRILVSAKVRRERARRRR